MGFSVALRTRRGRRRARLAGWTDHEQNRREAVVLRAPQILVERIGATRLADTDPAERDGSPGGESPAAATEASPAGVDNVPF
jgi:hypothetical protein